MAGSGRAAWQQCLKHMAKATGKSSNFSKLPERGFGSLGRCVGGIRQSLTHHGAAGGGRQLEEGLLLLRSLHSSSSSNVVSKWGSAQLNGSDGRSVAGFVGSSRNFFHSACSPLVKSQVQRSLGSSGRTWLLTPKRNLSSSETSVWTQKWKEATQKVKDSLNLKPRGGSSSVSGLKLGNVLPSRAREVLSEASTPVQKTFAHYREAVLLQLEAFWKRNYVIIVGFVGVGVCLLLWRLMFGIASTFITMSEGLAKFGFLALAASMVIVGGVVLRGKYTINPDSVYRIAMRKLNTSAAVLEVMGAPLSGTDLRAYIMSGGGLRFKGLRPRLAGKRCFIIFPIRGSERKGLVSLEVKKKKGKYDFKLLAVDVPTARGDQRLFLIGDENEYKVGGGLISELRDPIVTAMAAQKEFEDMDMKEEEEDEKREAEAQQKIFDEEVEKLEKERNDVLRDLVQHQAQVKVDRAEDKNEEKDRVLA
ncbi:hypothetical protein R1flu_009068 [Riccia fluitans]|uniref:Import inner membrane translocase subunit n=1 Tax=Riccia fluitans TaxID=41844 RepID=A0ABD1Z115_9MARC